MMCGSVRSHQSGTVQEKDHRQVLNGYIMNDLVVGPLHKGGVDIAERDHSRSSKTSRKSDSMLLCNSYIVGAVGHLIHHDLQGGSRGHGRSDPDYLLIA